MGVVSDNTKRNKKQNVVTTLRNFANFLESADNDHLNLVASQGLDNVLDLISANDGFGTEGQLDPRGDQRDND